MLIYQRVSHHFVWKKQGASVAPSHCHLSSFMMPNAAFGIVLYVSFKVSWAWYYYIYIIIDIYNILYNIHSDALASKWMNMYIYIFKPIHAYFTFIRVYYYLHLTSLPDFRGVDFAPMDSLNCPTSDRGARPEMWWMWLCSFSGFSDGQLDHSPLWQVQL
jgi:hypothetical protein